MIESPNKRRASSVLGLLFDGRLIKATWLKRNNGSAEIQAALSAELSADPSAMDSELLGRDIRSQLEKAGIRERDCVVCIPQGWALQAQIQLPNLAGDDLEGFLQLEAERMFSTGGEAVAVRTSLTPGAEDPTRCSLICVARASLEKLDAAVRSAGLSPRSFCLGSASLHGLTSGDGETSMVLLPLGQRIHVLVARGGGILAMRTLEHLRDEEGGDSRYSTPGLLREVRITLAQLPAETRETLRTVRVFGEGPLVDRLASDLQAPARALNLFVDRVNALPSERLGFRLPPAAPSTPDVAAAAAFLAGMETPLEFLPPRITAWRRFTTRYASGALSWALGTVAVLAIAVAGLFAWQQSQLQSLRRQWAQLTPQVRELEQIQQDIRSYRPWFNETYPFLTIMKVLAESFPEEGSVTAKTVEIRENGTVVCTGTAKDAPSLYRAIDALRASKDVRELQLDQLRMKAPLQFSFNFRFGEKSQP
ncbi:MAG: hypothetical protein FJ405_14720 [Verrucomicrobia bacterium]|nr:hypothetical protein [Verrucomicrobiota bacterium]